MKLLKLLLLVLTGLLFTALPIYAVNLYTETEFRVFINNTGSIGFTMQPTEWVTVTATTGAINSSEARFEQTRNGGFFSFNPNETGTYTMGVGNLTVWVDGSPVGTGSVRSMSIGVPVMIRWRPIAWDPFEYYTYPAIGLGGFILIALSGFWTARQLRDWQGEETIFAIGWGILSLVIGCGLVIVWLWG